MHPYPPGPPLSPGPHSPTTCWQMENMWTMMVVKSPVSEGNVVSSNAYTVCRWIDGRNSQPAKRICCSPTRSSLPRSSCCISPPSTGSRELSIPGSMSKGTRLKRGTQMLWMMSREFPPDNDQSYAEQRQETSPPCSQSFRRTSAWQFLHSPKSGKA